jgi:hypothetical protein
MVKIDEQSYCLTKIPADFAPKKEWRWIKACAGRGSIVMSTDEFSEKEASYFWSWFRDQRITIESLLNGSDVNALKELVGPRVAELTSRLGWELGPGLKKRYAFSFTLNGDIANARIAAKILRCAPTFEQWELHVGRPRKNWDLTFRMRNQKEQKVFINAASWEYYLTSFGNDTTFDITLIGHDLPSLDDEAKMQAASIVIQGCIGERNALERIDSVNILTECTELMSDSLTNITYLYAHLNSMCGGKLD